MAKDNLKKATDKAKAVAKKTGNTIKDNPIKAVYVAGGLLLVYVGYQTIKRITEAFTHANVDDNVSSTGGQTSNATITSQQATNFAQQLLDAMNYNRNSILLGGTDEDMIDNVFDNLQNGDDFNLVFRAFGKKEYNGENSPNESVIGFLDTYEPRDLVYWLNSELSSWVDYSLHQKVKNIVEQAGFSF